MTKLNFFFGGGGGGGGGGRIPQKHWSSTLLSNAYEPTSFKHGMILDITELYSLIPAGMTLTITQGHRAMRKLEHG